MKIAITNMPKMFKDNIEIKKMGKDILLQTLVTGKLKWLLISADDVNFRKKSG